MTKGLASSTFYTILTSIYLLILLLRSSLDGILSLTRAEGGGFSAGAALNVGMIALGLVCLYHAKRKYALYPALVWVPYISLMALSLVYTPDAAGGFRLLMSVATYPMIFITGLVLTQSEAQFAVVLNSVILSSIIPLVIVVLQLLGYSEAPDGRISGSFSHANILGFYMTAMFFSLTYLAYIGKERSLSRRRIGLFLCSVVMLVVLILTGARGAWIGGSLLLAGYLLFVERWLLIVVPFLPLLFAVPAISDRLSDLSDDSYSASTEQVTTGAVVLNSYAWRQMLWSYALADSGNARIIGKGAGSFRHNGPEFFPLQGVDENGNGVDAHSAYIQSIYELGTLGLIAYIFVYVAAGVIVLAVMPNVGGILLALLIIANMMFSYSDNVLYYLSYNWYVWGILGSAIGAYGRRLPGFALRTSSGVVRRGVRNRFFRLGTREPQHSGEP